MADALYRVYHTFSSTTGSLGINLKKMTKWRENGTFLPKKGVKWRKSTKNRAKNGGKWHFNAIFSTLYFRSFFIFIP